ncbi:WD-REPEATS-REGION domain-containing protein [Mycena kentingensis (nom. inval.)]|nr:WD-REPEATS-REGION domain-containing protein [Mycena kentingensis (nom. inval.)]
MSFHPPATGRRQSWMDARRPSWTPAPPLDLLRSQQRLFSQHDSASESDEASTSPPFEEEVGNSTDSSDNFRSMQIDMKMLVGDAVGNMSISATGRDIVLAARRGLFVIDLSSALSPPRFLPQGGSWDVADVQFNPHVSRGEYVVSTSSEKLLIWNLLITAGPNGGQPSAIQHILRGHYRAITDVNWHPAPEERDLVVSTGVDSWLWAWDLRAAKNGRAVFGLSAFNNGGTQVKWNRKDPHVLASSHGGEVLIWDRRKGSLPITRLPAHRSKIYGIDWSPTRRDELVTCSLDGTIKLWDVASVKEGVQDRHTTSSWGCTDCDPSVTQTHAHTFEPLQTIRTAHPVWRARHLPFGRGVLSLPQRGDTALGMYALGHANATTQPSGDVFGDKPIIVEAPMAVSRSRAPSWDGDRPVEVFEGHLDVVKEFVWRRYNDGHTFQLITWSKDRTLRFWPVTEDMMQQVGHERPLEETETSPAELEEQSSIATPLFSFRHPPVPESVDDNVSNNSGSMHGLTSPPIPALSAPIGARMILAGVRAGAPVVHSSSNHAPPAGGVQKRGQLVPPPGLLLSGSSNSPAVGSMKMSRGTAPGKRAGLAGVDALAWLSNVKEVSGSAVGGERSSSGGRGAGSSGGHSELEGGDSLVGSGGRRRSDSRGPRVEEGQSLQDELTSVINKLLSAKIKLEKHDLTKKRTCTLGLHGPWGESCAVFIRVTFTFPKDYPHGVHPRGTPTVELERNPLITLKNRVFILRRLRAIRERQRPCLEACLRFLSEGERAGALQMDSESSSDSETGEHKTRNMTVNLMRTHKNLSEPRTSQATFSPNGELVCFFRTTPRLVKHVLRDPLISGSPAGTTSDIPPGHDSVDLTSEPEPLKRFRSPALIADAVRRLTLVATDRVVKPLESRHPQPGDQLQRIMTNLLTFSDNASHRRESETSRQRGEDAFHSSRFQNAPLRRSTVFITSTSHISGADRKVAEAYVFQADSLAILCQRNAEIAKIHGRVDHERIFKILQALFPTFSAEYPIVMAANDLIVKMVTRIHEELCKLKDLQMLAMLAMIVLQACHGPGPTPSIKSPPIRGTPTPRNVPFDYFSISRPSTHRMSPISPTWPRNSASPPIAQQQPALSTSGSSRGSWSSLFNAGSVRQFMSGVQDSFMTPSELPASTSIAKENRAISLGQLQLQQGPESPLTHRRWRDSSGLGSPSIVSKSWHETTTPPGMKQLAVSFSSAGHKRVPFSTPPHQQPIHESRVVVYDVPVEENEKPLKFPSQKMEEFACHVHIYADLLFNWELYRKRLELLKSLKNREHAQQDNQHGIGIHRQCTTCGLELELGKDSCPNCLRYSSPRCNICRLTVKKLSRSCLRCLHITHVSCWRRLDVPICPSGCGCLCDALPPTTAPLPSLPFPPTLGPVVAADHF